MSRRWNSCYCGPKSCSARSCRSPTTRIAFTNLADGDGRYLLTLSEELFALRTAAPLDVKALGEMLQKRAPAYDKDREEHYNLISALHKSIRGSDPDAALYWLARMVTGGEDLLFIARRLVCAAAEDVGLADPTALLIANAAKDAVHFIGPPEAELHLAQAVIHLATAPKSNAAYLAGAPPEELRKRRARSARPCTSEMRDEADEGVGVRVGVHLRSRRRGRLLRAKLLPR